jgi:hypothetical protein
MRQLGLVLAIALLAGCAVSPADRHSAREAWEKRDEERARECLQQRGRYIAGSCSFGGR